MGSCCSAALARGARRPRWPSSGAWSRSSRRGWPPWAPSATAALRCPSARALRERRCGNSCRSSTHRALRARSRSGARGRRARRGLDPLTVGAWCARNTRAPAARLVTDVMGMVVLGTASLACRSRVPALGRRAVAAKRRRGRAQNWRVCSGTGLIAEWLADGLAGKVRFDSPVRVVRRWAGAASCSIRARDRSERAARSSQWIPRSSRACGSSRDCPHATASFAGDRGWAAASRSMLATRGPSGATPAFAGRP